MFTLTIDTANDAFGEDPSSELARILCGIAEDLPYRAMGVPVPVRDVNGNRIGVYMLTTEG